MIGIYVLLIAMTVCLIVMTRRMDKERKETDEKIEQLEMLNKITIWFYKREIARLEEIIIGKLEKKKKNKK